MKEIALTQGKVALVDDEDYEQVMRFKWRASQSREGSSWYALRSEYVGGKETKVWLHRFLLDAMPGQLIDHENGDGLDCRRANLRHATHRENSRNRRRRHDAAVPFKGVRFDRRCNRFYAYIAVNRRNEHIGTFRSAEDAAAAYDQKARELYGAFARLNFPRSGEQAT